MVRRTAEGLPRRTFVVREAVPVMMEHDDRIHRAKLVAFGRRGARVTTEGAFPFGGAVALTVSVPETEMEKTQALYRLSTSVEKRRRGAKEYLLRFSEADLEAADALLSRLHGLGLIED